jgi:hypothetical protein
MSQQRTSLRLGTADPNDLQLPRLYLSGEYLSFGGSATKKKMFAANWTFNILCFTTSPNTVPYIFLLTHYTGLSPKYVNTQNVYFNFVPFVTKTSVAISHIIPQMGYKHLHII